MSNLTRNHINAAKFRLAESTFAAMPGASTKNRQLWRATDIGTNGAILQSDGTVWRPHGGCSTLLRTTIPIGVAGAWGSGGANGALVFTTAHPTGTAVGAYLYYYANTLNGAQPAAFHWTAIAADGQTAVVYTATYTPGTVPTVPTTLTPMGTVTSTYAGPTVGLESPALISISLPAGCLNTDGGVAFSMGLLNNNSANEKKIRAYLGTTMVFSHTATTATSRYVFGTTSNLGYTNKQGTITDASGTAFTFSAVDTSAATVFEIKLQHTVVQTSQSLMLTCSVDLVG